MNFFQQFFWHQCEWLCMLLAAWDLSLSALSCYSGKFPNLSAHCSKKIWYFDTSKSARWIQNHTKYLPSRILQQQYLMFLYILFWICKQDNEWTLSCAVVPPLFVSLPVCLQTPWIIHAAEQYLLDCDEEL